MSVDTLLATVVVAELLLIAGLAWSIARPARRVWPPGTWRAARFWWTWILTAWSFAATLILAWRDAGTFVLDGLAWKVASVVLVALGVGLADWGVRTLGSHASRGLRARFRAGGPYRWSRNPQYVGHVLVALGVGLIADSTRAWIALLLAIAATIVTPLAEEPWLEEQYGEPYRAYRARVARFLGRPRG